MRAAPPGTWQRVVAAACVACAALALAALLAITLTAATWGPATEPAAGWICGVPLLLLVLCALRGALR